MKLSSFSSLARSLRWLCAGLLVTAAGAAAAQYPDRPIRIVVPFGAGGGSDTYTRMLARELSQAIGQSVVIENRPGVSGAVGTAAVAAAPADGYTLLSAGSWMAQSPHLNKRLTWNPLKDFATVTQFSFANMVLMVSADLPIKSIPDLVAHAKANPNRLQYATVGVGTTGHIYGETLARLSGFQWVHVPYPAGAKAMLDLLGGQVPAVFTDIGTAGPHLNNPRIRALAVSGAERSSLIPETPTFTEIGLTGMSRSGWTGIVAPAGTPEPIVALLSRHLVEIVNRPDVSKQLITMGVLPYAAGYQAFDKRLKEDYQFWGDLIRNAGIEIQ